MNTSINNLLTPLNNLNNLLQVVYNEADMAPCTAKAAVELLRQTGLELQGLETVVVGHR